MPIVFIVSCPVHCSHIDTVLCYLCAYTLNNLRQIHLANPIELVRGGQEGEKEPKTNWLLAIIGILCLGGGYFISLTTKSPLNALMLFFVAVILVIIGTYALFTAVKSIIVPEGFEEEPEVLLQDQAFHQCFRDDLQDEAKCSRPGKYMYFVHSYPGDGIHHGLPFIPAWKMCFEQGIRGIFWFMARI